MTCDQAEALLAELLAGEIRPEDRRAIERHLLECAPCRADFDRARAGLRVEWPDAAVPAALVSATRALLDRPPALIRFLRAGTAAAAALLAILFVAASSPPKTVPPAVRPAAPILAAMQEGAVGSLVAKDEDGRPVGDLGLRSHVVSVEILDGIAKTTVEENFENHTDRRLEGTFHFPLPPDASISRLALEVNGKMEEGTCLERERAREVFESIVRKMQDPALLEWMPGGMFKCRVFPIEPRATKRVLVAYTQALPFFRGRMTYVYPLASEKTRAHPPGEVRIDVRVRVTGRLDRIESPSHRIDVQRRDEREAAMSFRAGSYRPENDFVVTMETTDEEARVVPHKADGDDGTFALFLAPRGAGARTPRRYAFVLDVSASVSAPELEVAKRLVRAMMERRIEGDRFQVLAHHIDVERSGEVDLRGADDFMDRLRPVGGSDVLKALLAADADEIVYIGEGTPTMGETDLPKILEAVKGRRIRTIAVGSDANTALLERLGGHQRISPNDDVTRRVAEIAETLGSPVLSDIKIDGGDALYDMVGIRDIFFGERLVVAGRYRGPAAKLVITGRDYRREVEVSFPPKEEGNSYVRRLWAQRKVAELLARGGAKDEVVALGVKHQIMTPYTSFLVLETEQMWKDHQLKREIPKQDEVLGRKDELQEKVDKLLSDGTALYTQGKTAEATAKFEEAFQYKPSSDQVYAYIKRVGEDLVGRMMNESDRKLQDTGRRLFELAKPGEPFRSVEETKAKMEELRRAITSVEEVPRREQPIRQETRALGPLASPYDPNHMRLGATSRIERSFRLARGERERYTADDPTGEVGPGFTTNESARLDSYDVRAQTFHTFQSLDPLTGLSVGDDGGYLAIPELRQQVQFMRGKRTEYASGEALNKVLLAPTAGGAGPLTGATFSLDNDANPGQIGGLEFTPAELEERHVGIARTRKGLEERMNHLNQLGVNPTLVPAKLIDGQVTATANEIGLTVFSQGKDQGVLEGDEVVVTRGGEFVARVVIDRADPRWSAGKIVAKSRDPRPGDDVRIVSTSVPVPEGERIPVRNAPSESSYRAKVESGKFISGQPPQAVGPIAEFELRRLLDAELSRDATGRPLGQLNYDPQTNVFIARDRVAALDRMGSVLDRLDVESKTEYAAIVRRERLEVTMTFRDGALAQVVDEFRRQTGWTIALDARNIPEDHRIEEFIVVKEPARKALEALAKKAGVILVELGPAAFHLLRPVHLTFNFRDIEVSVILEMIRRVDSPKIDVSPEFRGKVTLSVENIPWTEVLAMAAKRLNFTTERRSDGSIRVVHPDELLREMETRVFRLKHLSVSGGGVVDEIRPVLNALLTRNAQGRPLGDLDYLFSEKQWVVRDTPRVRERVREVAGLLDVAPGETLGEFQCRTLSAGRPVDLLREVRAKLASGADPEPSRGALCEELRKLRKAEVVAAMRVADSDGAEVLFPCGTRESMAPGQVLAISRDSKFVALVQILEAGKETARGRVWRGLAAGRVLAGDRAEMVSDVRAYLAALPEAVRIELGSRAGIETIRAKMRIAR